MKIASVVGYSGSGKTKLLEKLSNYLDGSVGVVKHIHKFDKKGKDTDRLMENADYVVAGAEERVYKIKESDDSLNDSLLALLGDVDIALVEGYKGSSLPKIVLGKEVLEECDGEEFLVLEEKPVFGDHVGEIVDFIEEKGVVWKNYNELVRELKSQSNIDRAGAIGGFTGIVRGFRGEDRVEGLFFEKYEEKADKEIREIEDELEKREGIVGVEIHHREGMLDVGEDIVYVVVAAEHRKELFEALSDGIDFVKDRATIWKKEILVGDEEKWVHDI